MSLVSVLIPAYNHEAYVSQTLDSVLGDSYSDKEIVIIDDGSTDRTDAVIRTWIEQHGDSVSVKYRSRPNVGLTATLNELLSMAEGEFIVTLASDDYLLDGGIARRVAFLREHSEKYAVFGDAIVVDMDGNTISESALFDYRHANRENLISDAGIRKEFLTNFSMPGPVLMVRRSYYAQFGGYDDEMYMEDYDLYLKFAGHNLIGFIDTTVSAYRIHDTNMSDEANPMFVRLLQDSIGALLHNRHLFHGYEKLLLYRQVAKFGVRIFLFRLMRLGNG